MKNLLKNQKTCILLSLLFIINIKYIDKVSAQQPSKLKKQDNKSTYKERRSHPFKKISKIKPQKILKSSKTTCEDTEKKVSVFHAGTVTGICNIGIKKCLKVGLKKLSSNRYQGKDYCLTKNKLRDFYCSKNQISSKDLSCSVGEVCKEGRCIKNRLIGNTDGSENNSNDSLKIIHIFNTVLN